VAIKRSGKVWAVALPVRVCYLGEPRPGDALAVVPSTAGAQKKPAACLSGIGKQRAATAGIYLTPRAGVPVEAPSVRQPAERIDI